MTQGLFLDVHVFKTPELHTVLKLKKKNLIFHLFFLRTLKSSQ